MKGNGWDSLCALLAEARLSGAGQVVLEDDGNIGIDWGEDSGRVISVSVNASGSIGFAALIDGWKAHGSSDTYIPDDLIVSFRRLQGEP